jgi:diguanylate cyclase (GGDEF)-like protein
VDQDDLRFRLSTVHTGVALTVVTAALDVVYTLATWSEPNRGPLLALGVIGLASAAIVRALPVSRLIVHEAFFLGWSAMVVAVIAVGVALDGGATSPLTLALVLPLSFAALSYPLRSTLAVGAMVVAAYLVVAVGVGGAPPAGTAYTAAVLATIAWMCAWQAVNQARVRSELALASRTDPLTGALNRGGFDARFAAALAHAERHGEQLGLVVLDLDHFKAVNDRSGHAAGDDVLRWTVTVLLGRLRGEDALGRLGGDEFAVLLPSAGPDEAEAAAARLRIALAERAPCSTGVASFPASGSTAAELHRAADAALYEAKRRRRPAVAA